MTLFQRASNWFQGLGERAKNTYNNLGGKVKALNSFVNHGSKAIVNTLKEHKGKHHLLDRVIDEALNVEDFTNNVSDILQQSDEVVSKLERSFKK